MKTVLAVLGTRPEKVKLEPVFRALFGQARVVMLETGQHTDLISKTSLGVGEYDKVFLQAELSQLTLAESLGTLVSSVSRELKKHSPDVVLVQGDTISALAGGLAAKFSGHKVGHVEAGLRTHDSLSPWPEEIVRKTLAQLADIHFAPTSLSRKNLVDEGVDSNRIFVTGNTSVDVVEFAKRRLGLHDDRSAVSATYPKLDGPIIVTLHRRESHGRIRRRALQELGNFLREHPQFRAKIVMHPNPAVRQDLEISSIQNHPGVTVCEPLSHDEMLGAIAEAPFVISDSGGIQEEAPSLGKPVFIARDLTERPEAVDLEMNFLCQADLTGLPSAYQKWVSAGPRDYSVNPFGDGTAGKQIAQTLLSFMGTL